MNERWNWKKIYKVSNNLSEFLDHVHTSPMARYYKIKTPRPTKLLPLKTRRMLANNILEQLYPEVLVFADQRMSPRVECICLLLEKKYWVGKSFAIAIGRVTGAYPLPKWWRVWRKVAGNIPASQFAAPKDTPQRKASGQLAR